MSTVNTSMQLPKYAVEAMLLARLPHGAKAKAVARMVASPGVDGPRFLAELAAAEKWLTSVERRLTKGGDVW